MTKAKKPDTTNIKSGKVINKNRKKSALNKIVSAKTGVSKPNHKKHEIKLPGNLKQSVKQESKVKLNKSGKSANLPTTISFKPKITHLNGTEGIAKDRKANVADTEKQKDYKKDKNDKALPDGNIKKNRKKNTATISLPDSSKIKKQKQVKSKTTLDVQNVTGSVKKGAKKGSVKKVKKEQKKLISKESIESKNKADILRTSTFDNEQFNNILTVDNINKVIEALQKLVSDEMKLRSNVKTNQIFPDHRYLITVSCFKIPMCPKRMVRLKLKHSVVDKDDDVCLIVKDLHRGKRSDYEDTIHHYEDLLKEKGIKGIKAIIPFKKLKAEHSSYEMKRKFTNMYDYYLCDGCISKHVSGFLGKFIRKTRCTIHPVRMIEENINSEIEKSLRRTSYRQGEKGVLIAIPVGTYKMSPKNISENILTVMQQLKDIYPGGYPNIRNVYAKIDINGTSSLPLYISMASPPENTPTVTGIREQKLRKLSEEARNILKKFEIDIAGNVEMDIDMESRKKRRTENEDDEQPPIKKGKVASKKKQKNKKSSPVVENAKVEKKIKKKVLDESSEALEENKKAGVEIKGSEINDTTSEEDSSEDDFPIIGEKSSDESDDDEEDPDDSEVNNDNESESDDDENSD